MSAWTLSAMSLALPWALRAAAAACGALVGAAIGSFLTVVVDRVPRGESVVFPPSRCFVCERRLSAWEMVPIVSYLAQRGRCRTCDTAIGPQSLAIEVATAALFASIAAVYLWSPATVWVWTLAALGVALSAVDFERHILPNRILLAGLVCAIVIEAVLRPLPLSAALLGGALMAALGLAFATASGGMGMGDVKLLGLMGVFLGAEAALLAFFAGAAAGALVGGARALLAGGSLKDAIPFGPPLVGGALFSLGAFPAIAGALHLPQGGIWG